MVEPQPHGFQSENHLIDDGYYWTKEREASWDDLKAALDPVAGPLWDNSSSSYNGCMIALRRAQRINSVAPFG